MLKLRATACATLQGNEFEWQIIWQSELKLVRNQSPGLCQ